MFHSTLEVTVDRESRILDVQEADKTKTYNARGGKSTHMSCMSIWTIFNRVTGLMFLNC